MENQKKYAILYAAGEGILLGLMILGLVLKILYPTQAWHVLFGLSGFASWVYTIFGFDRGFFITDSWIRKFSLAGFICTNIIVTVGFILITMY